MSNCTCGRTTRPPLCDGSHWLSDEEYKQRTEKLAQLYNKDLKENTNNRKENHHVKTTI